MKTQILSLAALAITSIAIAQDVTTNQVPSVIQNKFMKQFTDATDIEWEMDGHMYNVEFETAWGKDHTIWYNANGTMVKHKKDITAAQLPQKVKNAIKKQLGDYTIEDVEEITTAQNTFYTMELNALLKQDWEITIDANGTIVNKKAD